MCGEPSREQTNYLESGPHMNKGVVLTLTGVGLLLCALATVRLSNEFRYIVGDLSALLVIGGALGAIVGFGLVCNGLLSYSYYALPTFQGYKSKHPDLVGKGGQVKCYNCADTRRRMWRLAPDFGPTKHYCVQCGTALYRS